MWKWLHRSMAIILAIVCLHFLCAWSGIWNPLISLKKAISNRPNISGQLFRLDRDYLSYFNEEYYESSWAEVVTGSTAIGYRAYYEYTSDKVGVDTFDLTEFPGIRILTLIQVTPTGGSYMYPEVLLIEISYWLLALLTGIYPAIFFIRSYRRRRAHRQALQPCEQCGYDLQGNESGVCPECGEAAGVTA